MHVDAGDRLTLYLVRSAMIAAGETGAYTILKIKRLPGVKLSIFDFN